MAYSGIGGKENMSDEKEKWIIEIMEILHLYLETELKEIEMEITDVIYYSNKLNNLEEKKKIVIDLLAAIDKEL